MPQASALPQSPESRRSVLLLLVALALAIAFSAALVANADAAPITGGTDDAFETPPNVDGIARYPDLARVDASYDPAVGRITFTVRTHQAVSPVWTGLLASHGVWTVSQATHTPGTYRYRCPMTPTTGVGGSMLLQSQSASFREPTDASIAGFDGRVAVVQPAETDGIHFMAEATNPNLIGRSYNCFSFRVVSYYRSSPEVLASRYRADCDCWVTSRVNDVAGEPTINSNAQGSWDVWDHGIALGTPFPPLPVCADGIDNDGDGKVDLSDPDCADANWGSEHPQCSDGIDNDGDGKADLDDIGCLNNPGRTSEVDPAIGRAALRVKASALKRCRIAVTPSLSRTMEPASLFPVGKFSVRITGPKRLRFNRTVSGTSKTVRVKVRRSGTYTIKTIYLGDRFRTKSKTTTTKLRVPSKRC